jgi:acetylornithine aminotransferase
VPFNDLAALEAAINPETCAVILEPIQGEGGLHVPSADYLAGVRALCDRHRITLIFDEVWTGCGRTGKFFAFQHAGVTPDILTLGKALGGGLPVGCMFARPELAALLKPGTHGCTLGGNPICAAAAATVLEVLHKEELPARAAHLGTLAMQHIRAFKNAEARIKQVRGQGLMIGIELLAADGAPVVKKAFALGLIINATQKNVLRLSPALTLSESTLATGLELLEQSLDAA